MYSCYLKSLLKLITSSVYSHLKGGCEHSPDPHELDVQSNKVILCNQSRSHSFLPDTYYSLLDCFSIQALLSCAGTCSLIFKLQHCKCFPYGLLLGTLLHYKVIKELMVGTSTLYVGVVLEALLSFCHAHVKIVGGETYEQCITIS